MKIIYLTLMFVTLTSCFQKEHEVARKFIKINTLSDTTFVIVNDSIQKNIWGIELKVKGAFNDTIFLLYPGQEDRKYYKIIGGEDSVYRNDWYSDTCLLRFENIKEPINDLIIEYEFFEL